MRGTELRYLALGGALAAVALSVPAPSDAVPPAWAAAAGTYRLQFDTDREAARTWSLTADCQGVTAPCLRVVGQAGTEFQALMNDGRWQFVVPWPINKTCSSPPISTTTWSWDPSTLTGTEVNHIADGCPGVTEGDQVIANFTMTKVS